jgi:dGTPase
MRGHGGFEHNKQSLRIVEELEQKYPTFSGLNLSWEVREGLVKHYPAERHPSKKKGFDAKFSSLEAQVANLADEIAYYSHDLDDGLESELLPEAQLEREVRIWSTASRIVKKEHGQLPDECRRYFTIRCLIDLQVKDVVTNTERLIEQAGIKSSDEARLHSKALVNYSLERRKDNLQLREFLYKNLYYNPVVNEPHLRARRVLEDLFQYYLEHHDEIGTASRNRARTDGWHRAICDHLSGMTDRYAIQQHQRLFALTT